MANLQYVGPRVVPKPYRNPDTGNAEWKSGIEYEALIMVTYLSNGYVSAKPVPSSVGNPADNPDYWVESADFDAALSDLQNRVHDLEDQNGNETLTTIAQTLSGAVNELDSEIKEINGRPRYIFIGDSYGTGKPFYGTTGWIDQVISILGLTNNVNAFKFASDGAGFASGSSTFENLLDNAISNISEPDRITNIFIGGGYNDIDETNAAVTTAINNFCTKAKNNFPNAKITLAFLSTYDGGINSSINGLKYLLMKACYCWADGRYNFIPDLYSVLLSSAGLIGSDGIHPTVTGYNLLSIAISQAILGATTKDIYYSHAFTLTPEANITILGTENNKWVRSRDIVQFIFNPFRFQNQDASDTSDVTNYKKFATINNIAFDSIGSIGDTSDMVQFTVADSNNDIYDCVATLAISNNDLYLKLDLFHSNGTAFKWNEIAFIQGRHVQPEFTINVNCI